MNGVRRVKDKRKQGRKIHGDFLNVWNIMKISLKVFQVFIFTSLSHIKGEENIKVH